MKGSTTSVGGMTQSWLKIHVRAKTEHHINTDGLQGPRQDLELRKPQVVSCRPPHAPCVTEGSMSQPLEGNQE